MGRRYWKGQNDNWNTSLSKRNYRSEKKFDSRERRLRNATTFFVSNLPDDCNRDSLWKAFEHLGNLEDVFVPFKKDRAGGRFGFVKLSNISDPDWWISKLKEVRIGGAVIGVNVARFHRDGSKVESINQVSRVSVFDRLHGLGKPAMKDAAPAQPAPTRFGQKSYCSIVKNSEDRAKAHIELPPMNTVTKKSLESKSLVGEAKDIETLNNLQECLSGIMDDGLQLKYLGGLKVLLCFSKPDEAEEFRHLKVDSWEKWFSRLYVWDGIPPLFERIAWVKVLGVPVSLWDRHVINKIGERCGRLVVKSDAEVSDGNMAEDRLAILVKTGKRISEEFNVIWKDQQFCVWVEEISGKWSPAFLNVETSEFASPATESYNNGSPSPGRNDSGHCMGDSSFPCMGNQNTCMSPLSNVDRSPSVVSGDVQEPDIVLKEVREKEVGAGQYDALGADFNDVNGKVGTTSGTNVNCPNVDHADMDDWATKGSDFDVGRGLERGPNITIPEDVEEPLRPSYITCRPKSKKSNFIQAQPFIIPDLNNSTVDGESSDPFNIEEIFRQEAEVNQRPEEPRNTPSVPAQPPDPTGELEIEVESTLELGARIGIEVEGFRNHVKKIVNGERDISNRQ
ncbi:putative RNA recognition motif domain, nucleotide-binding alpha-beta plait domain superfamily [Helianthus annuus]|nr:putative RNA recognition motif domain, nucleotide-binding alpha-beta plait domain superfamily [Helianthus annuus]